MDKKILSAVFWDAMIQEDQKERSGKSQPTNSSDPVFAKAYDKLYKVMVNKPIQQELLRRTLEFCRAQKPVDEVEQIISSYPEYPLLFQPPYRFIKYLIDGGGLVQNEFDAQGKQISPEAKRKLNPDDLDDLVDSYVLQTTDVGKAIADDMAPMKRMKDMFLKYQDRAQLFIELLEFCRAGHTYTDIESLITTDKIINLQTYNFEPGVMMKPSVFVDNMEKAGGLLFFDHAWHTTNEGIKVLQALG